MSRWVFPKRIASAKLKFWASIFGKNTWRFTPTQVYGEFEGRRFVSKLRVLWADDWSAVVLFRDAEAERVHHIHFDGDWFYLLAGRDNVEYFHRVTLNRQLQPTRSGGLRPPARAAELSR
jgi:hypothetical protein